jgi:hypothetical protein
MYNSISFFVWICLYDCSFAHINRNCVCVFFFCHCQPLVTIASLKFHARVLTDRELEDIFKNGKMLVEVATGKSPTVVETTVLPSSTAAEANQIADLDFVLQQNDLQLEDFRKLDQRHIWAGQPLSVLQGPVQGVQKVDEMFNNIPYTSIVDNPVQIETFVPVNVSTLPELRADERCVGV